MEKKKTEGKKRQTMRYSDSELALIKATFAENDDLLRAIRKLMLQMPLDVIEKAELDSAFKGNREALKVVRKSYLPQLDGNAPFNQVVDLWMTIGDIKDKQPEDVWYQFVAREKLLVYIDEQLQRLENGTYDKVPGIKFAELTPTSKKPKDEAFVDIIVRNTVIGHNEMQITQLSTLAGMKAETVEETTARLRKDSSQ